MNLNKLGRYDIIRVIGKGAMGLVYEARDPNLDRRVAIKTIRVDNLSAQAAADYEARFRIEAHSAARLQHPNIVSVYDSDRHGNIAFLVMEFIQGEDLKHHLDGGKRYTLAQSLGMVRDLLSALDYAHRQNVVHRDVKPANLLIEADGRVKLTDFGVARIQDSSEVTRTKGSMVGTLKYMSPEQVQGQPIDARSDLFAAAIVLYQLLTGQRPFDGDTDFAIIQQVVGHTPVAPSSINAMLPSAIDAVVARALAKEREQRFATAQEFALALQDASDQASDPSSIPPASQSGGRGGGGTDTGPQRSRASGSTARMSSSADDTGSSVTQEIELVYWKDIKDSDDPHDLEGFLDKFPAGIYADLARRRLKRLAGTARAEDPGAGSVAASMAVAPAAQSDRTLLQARDPFVPPSAGDARAADANASDVTQMDVPAWPLASPDVGSNSTAVTAPLPVAPEQAQAPAAAPPERQPESMAPPSSAAPPQRRTKTPMFTLAAVAILVAAAGAFNLLSGVAPPSDVASPAVAPPAVVSAAPAPSPAPAAATPTAAPPSPAASPAPVAVRPTAAPPPPAVAALEAASPVSPKPTPKRVAVIAGAEKSPSPMQSPASSMQAGATVAVAVARPAAPPATAAAIATAAAPAKIIVPALASNPRQACENRLLLGFQICMNEQCARQEFSNHPVCVERLVAEKLRREAQPTGRN